MVVYYDEYVPAGSTSAPLASDDILRLQEYNDRMHAARVLATVFEASDLATQDWKSKSGLQSLIVEGHPDSTSPGLERIVVPSSIHWKDTQILDRDLPPAWMSQLRTEASGSTKTGQREQYSNLTRPAGMFAMSPSNMRRFPVQNMYQLR